MDWTKNHRNAIFVLWLCSSFVWFSVTDAGDASCGDGPKSAALTLRKKLFCDYDTTVRPVKFHTNTTDVQFHMWLKFILFHDNWNTLDVHSWVVWEWKDEHLTWNKDEFQGLDRLRVSSSDIWVPDVALYSSADMGNTSPRMGETHCVLDDEGKIFCVSPTVHSAYCNADITRWPFDTHNCTMRIGSWTATRDQLNLTLFKKGVTTSEYAKNREWELLSSAAYLQSPKTTENITYSFASFSFELKRHSGGHAATVFIPSLVLATLTLAIFWIEPQAVERMGLICLNVLTHALYLQYLGSKLPSNGDKYPIILLFYRDSLLLVGVSLLVTMIVRRMEVASSVPPVWITTVTDAVLSKLPGQILMYGETNQKAVTGTLETGDDDATELIELSAKDQRWHLFAVLIDRSFFFIFFLTFIILLLAFIPS